jgi:hypothetical protein
LGVHPNLQDGFLTFDKFIGIGSEPNKNIDIVKSYFESINIPMETSISDSTTIELMKVLSTTMYGVNIAMMFQTKQMCDALHTNFNTVYTKWQKNYNKGYSKLNKNNVQRPILKLPNEKDLKIGGHCVSNNAKILESIFPDNWMSFVIDKYTDKSKLY